MTFGEAIYALKRGEFVARKGWNGRGMFLFLVEGSEVKAADLRGNAAKAAEKATELEDGVPGSSRRICPHIDMKAADGSIVVGWLASQTDMLSDDWIILS